MGRSLLRKRLALITVVYWFLLAYLIAALAWWFIELWQQNEEMYRFKKDMVHASDPSYPVMMERIRVERDRNIAQYIGEGATFLLLTLAGALFVYRATRRQIRMNAQQQNFMMAVTHELKTPIAVAKLNLETLGRHELDREKQQKIIRSALQETNRLNDLCNNILLSSQLEAGGYEVNREKCNLSTLAEETVQAFRQRFPSREIVAIIDAGIHAEADILMIRLAMNNLLDNALKYAPDEKPIRLSLSAAGNQAEFIVQDEGPGVPDGEKARIFERFYRIGQESTRSSKGTGLGLYLTRKIIEDHKGSIFIQDNLPQGSTFIIRMERTGA
jgi:two-component system, OmpR family, sensor histidine kinase CiaH